MEFAGTSDLAWDGRKVSGNAQQRKARHVLHHGTLLYGFDLPAVARYLNPPEREPPYRAGRPHADFVTNLPTDAATLRRLLITAFGAAAGEVTSQTFERVSDLVAEKYATDAWVRRR
jgi:lipoate-protein ligase A